jgi:hypothetical protein
MRSRKFALGLLGGVAMIGLMAAGTPPAYVSIIETSVANVLIQAGTDASGVLDSSTGINAAAALLAYTQHKSVYLPTGTYHVAHQLNLTSGQCLYGDSRGGTIITVGADFDPTATAVMLLSGGNLDPGPCVHDVAIEFTQPTTDVVTTTTTTSAAATDTITVASLANIAVNDSVTDATTTNAIPTSTYFKVSSINTGTNVITLSANIQGSGVGSGDSIHFGPSRSTFTTLASGCTVGLGGTGCEYPPAIASNSDSTRMRFENLRITGAWDGITTNGHNTVFWLKGIEMSAFDIGLSMGITSGVKDFSHINEFHFWDFDIPSTSLLYTNVYKDGGTFAAKFGEVDGLDAKGFTDFGGRISINSSSFWGEFSNLMLDNNNATFEVTSAQHVEVANVYATGQATGTNTACQINLGAGELYMTNARLTSAGTSICASGGRLIATDGRIAAGASGGTANIAITGADATFDGYAIDGVVTISSGNLSVGGNTLFDPVTTGTKAISQTGGTVSVIGARISPNTGAGSWTVPLFAQTSGVFRLTNSLFNSSTGDVGIFSLTDTASNVVSGNQFNNWGYTIPGPLGVYQPTSLAWQPVVITSSGTGNQSGATAETNLGAIKIPANSLGANGTIRVTANFSYTNNSDAKTVILRWNSTSGATSGGQITSTAQTTTAAEEMHWILHAANATNAQSTYVGGGGTSPFGTTGTAAVATTVDTTADSYININVTQAATGDNMKLLGYVVEVFHD